MDIGLYREDEQFSFPSSGYMDCYSSDSASFTIEQDELFEDMRRPMPQPPIEIFEWHSDDTEKELNNDALLDIDMIDQTATCNFDEALSASPPIKQESHTLLELQNWQHKWQPELDPKLEHVPMDTKYSDDQHVDKTAVNLQDVLELPDIANHLNSSQNSLQNIKIEQSCNPSIASSLSECSESTESDNSYRRQSESSDLLNSSFSSTEYSNFDIAEYVFEEDKQAKKSIELPEVETVVKYVSAKRGPDEQTNIDIKPVVDVEVSKRIFKAGVKKIDLKAQKYIIDNDIKSEDDCDIDIETVSEEENSPVLEAGDLTDLLEQFEATEVKSKEQITSSSHEMNIKHQNLSLNIKVEIKTEKPEKTNRVAIKVEPKVERKQIETTKPKPIKIKEEKIDDSYSVNIVKGTSDSPKVPDPQQKAHEQLYINYIKPPLKPVFKVQETTTSSKPPSASSKRQILDSLPQELINRIKESGKRKPITVIQPIPNNRKRSRIQEPPKTLPPINSESVHLDHNYCGNSVSTSNQIPKKDSGFASSEEDDRAVISRQPTVKNADGTLMVSLLKANTIRQVDSAINQKKKLNLEEYKKRRNGVLTSKNNSQSCSPDTSTCSSPSPEDQHQKMLKHQEKLRKMAQEVLKTAPKSEKKVEPNLQLIKIPGLLPTSPLASTVPSSQPVSPAINIKKEFPIKTEYPVKLESPSSPQQAVKVEGLIKVDVPHNKPVKIEPPKVPPNLERKVLVSFGVNTDIRIAKNKDPLAPVETLQEIRPLLEKASNKIKENSLISSVIENIPKIISKNEKSDDSNTKLQEGDYEHGEHKHVMYLEKNRVRKQTKDAQTQTNISLIDQSKRGRIRRRESSSSSCSSYKSKESASSRRNRNNSDSCSSSRSSVSSHSSSSSRSSDYSSRNSSRLSYSRSRSRSPKYNRRRRNSSAEREHLNAVEERRIIYVGKITTVTSKEDLRRKFHKFGPINKISLHFRDIGENYGFVTFKHKEDAHEAYEHGNDDPSYPCYKISFGGRREFCKAAYSDLDNMRDDAYYQSQGSGDSYDQLLKDALEKLKKRKV